MSSEHILDAEHMEKNFFLSFLKKKYIYIPYQTDFTYLHIHNIHGKYIKDNTSSLCKPRVQLKILIQYHLIQMNVLVITKWRKQWNTTEKHSEGKAWHFQLPFWAIRQNSSWSFMYSVEHSRGSVTWLGGVWNSMSAQRFGLDECSRTGDIVALKGTYREKQ